MDGENLAAHPTFSVRISPGFDDWQVMQVQEITSGLGTHPGCADGNKHSAARYRAHRGARICEKVPYAFVSAERRALRMDTMSGDLLKAVGDPEHRRFVIRTCKYFHADRKSRVS